MATLQISCLGGVADGVARQPLGLVALDTSTTSARATLPSGTRIVAVWSDAAHHVAVGPAASASATATNGLYLPANTERHIFIDPGQTVAARSLA